MLQKSVRKKRKVLVKKKKKDLKKARAHRFCSGEGDNLDGGR